MFQCNILNLVDLVCYATKMNKSLIKEYDMHFFFIIRKIAFYVTFTVDRTYSEGNSASQKNCRLSSNRSSIDKMKQLSINELLDNLHPYLRQDQWSTFPLYFIPDKPETGLNVLKTGIVL